ncbi:MAG: AIR synthase-related protein, partial [Bacteroidia bacterium]
ASSLSIGRGGLAAALLKTSIGGMLGVEVSVKKLPGKTNTDVSALFSESQGRILISISKNNKGMFEKVMRGASIREIGKVRNDGKIIIQGQDKKILFHSNVKEVEALYKRRFKKF